MSKKINQSIKFLIDEYKRLKNKKKLSEKEKETLDKLINFLGKKNEKY